MKRFDGNNILILDSDVFYSAQLKEVLSARGAHCLDLASLAEAEAVLAKYDFDMIITGWELLDGNLFDVVKAGQDHSDFMPIVVALGEGDDVCSELLEFYSIAAHINKKSATNVVEGISRLLFDEKDFLNCVLTNLDEAGIHYELAFKEGKHLIQPLEALSDGLSFTATGDFLSPDLVFLRIYCFEQDGAKTFTVAGHVVDYFNGSQFFWVHENYRPSWMKLLQTLTKKQASIMQFLKKAAGT